MLFGVTVILYFLKILSIVSVIIDQITLVLKVLIKNHTSVRRNIYNTVRTTHSPTRGIINTVPNKSVRFFTNASRDLCK